jgi:hypothetical protein
MDDPFELAAPEEARRFLRTFDRATRRKGEECFRQNRVSNLMSEADGTALAASVRGSELYEVGLEFEPGEGWRGECTCPLEINCKHVYAAMQAALAEHSVGSVRQLSEGFPGQLLKLLGVLPESTPQPGKKATEKAKAAAGDFGQKVASSLGRPIRPEEISFLRKLNQIYRRCCETRGRFPRPA